MRDSEVVASIVAGDPLGLAAAYDRYADPLYQYCRSLLGDPADAADAVQDTFVIAASRLDGLRDPARLRPWLYAVARNEALRIRRSATASGPATFDEATEATDVTGESGNPAAGAERAHLRALLEDAAAGLNPGEREIIELQLRQGLEPAEVASVLGVSRSHAHALLSRAREQLETCLAALLVGRAGRAECDALAALLADWDGRLTILLRKRVHRHIGQCGPCAARRAHELRPVMLLGLSPGAALAAGAAISLRMAAAAPDGLRAHTITLATGPGVGAVAHRAAVLSRAGAFGRTGFPKPVHGASAALAGRAGSGTGAGRAGGTGGGVRGMLRGSPRGTAAVTSVIAIAVIIAAVAFALTGNDRAGKPNHGQPGVAAAPAAATSAATGGASAAATTTMPATPAATSAAPTASATTSPAAGLTTSAPPPTGASATATSASPTAPASTPAARPTPGTLSVSPHGGLLVLPSTGSGGGQIDLGGSGSGDWDVSWSLTVANDPFGVISLSSSAGTLTTSGPTATVTVTASRFVPCDWRQSPTITVNPGGAVFTVCTSWHFTSGDAAPAVTAGGLDGSAR